MPKGTKQKLKLYYLSRIMLEKTDDEHALTMPQIQEELLKYGVSADRKSLYDDMEALRILGIDVIGEKEGRGYTYHVGKKHFDIAELKLLVDAVQSSKFITEKKSNELIKKITAMASNYEAEQLKRQVVVTGRVKTMNESIYYLVDDIHRAIALNRQISFEYMRWNTEKKMVRRRDGAYDVSPWALTWDDENYYLIAYDMEAGKIKHFRVDKMRSIRLLDRKRAGRDIFRDLDLASYTKMNFGMFGGERTEVKLSFKDEIAGVILDRFGRDIDVRPAKKKGWHETTVTIALSELFYGWIFALGTNIKLVSPKIAVEGYKEAIVSVAKMY